MIINCMQYTTCNMQKNVQGDCDPYGAIVQMYYAI